MKSEIASALQPAEQHLNGVLPQENLSSNESGEYSGDPSLYMPISSQDKDLLENFGIEYSEEIAKYLNDLIEQDIPDMRFDYDPALRQHIIQTRRYLFETLGITGEAFANWETSRPLQRTLATLRYLNSQKLDAAKIVNTLPQTLSLNPESVKAKMDNLTELGLDASKIVNTLPQTLSLNPESVKAKMDNLTELGLDAAKVVNTKPVALSYSPESVKAKMDNLNELGLDAAKVVNTKPQTLAFNPESVKVKMDNLTELGLNAVKTVNPSPSALCYNPDSVQAKMANLTEIGLDAVKMVNTLPAALSLNPSKINVAAYSLMKAGLWEESPSFEGYKAKLNRCENLNILMLPIESLMIYLDNNKPNASKGLTNQVRNYMKQQGLATGPKRKEAMLAMLDQPDARKRLGYLAVVYALKEKLEVEF